MGINPNFCCCNLEFSTEIIYLFNVIFYFDRVSKKVHKNALFSTKNFSRRNDLNQIAILCKLQIKVKSRSLINNT